MLGVGASRVSIAASVAEPQLAAAVVWACEGLCEGFDAAAYRCISIERGCLRSLASSLWGLCEISLFTCGVYYPVGFW